MAYLQTILGSHKGAEKIAMETKKEIMSNFIWRIAERSGAQMVMILVQIILARLLEPEVYGLVALITIFTSILQVFIESGIGSSLIQKEAADDLDFSSIFYFNIVFCTAIYAVLYLSTPYIADFLGYSELTAAFRVLSLTVLISGIKNVQQAYVSRNMMFKKFFFSTLTGTIIAAIVGIVMAYQGYGVWALVAQQIVNITVDTIILWLTVGWRPQRCFSMRRVNKLLSYGWKLMVSSLIDSIYNNMYQLLIGKVYSPADLAFYNQGRYFPGAVVENVNASIDSVMFPALSKEQNKSEHVKAMTKRAMQVSTYVLAPLIIGLASVAPTIVELLLTEKWMKCVPFLQIFCLRYLFWPMHTINLNAIKAMGRSDIFFRLEVLKKTIGVLLCVLLMRYGILALASSLAIQSLINQAINAYPNKKLLGYSYLEQFNDIISSIVLATIMGIVVYMFQYISVPLIFKLLIQVSVGASIYIAGSYIFKLKGFLFIKEMGIGLFKQKYNESSR